MNSLFKHGSFRFACLLLAATMLSITASPAAAVLVNKYTFNDGTATDLIGGQNGTLFGSGMHVVVQHGEVTITSKVSVTHEICRNGKVRSRAVHLQNRSLDS